MPDSEAKKIWDKENTTRIHLKLNNNTDADVIQQLRSVESIQGYIKSLIRADIIKEEKTMTYQINYTDPETGATSAIDTITARAGYTAEDYISDCDKNADPEWCEMLHRGEVSLEQVD